MSTEPQTPAGVREIPVPLDRLRGLILSRQVPVTRFAGAFFGMFLVVLLFCDLLGALFARPSLSGYLYAQLHRSDTPASLILIVIPFIQLLMVATAALCLYASPWYTFVSRREGGSLGGRIRAAFDTPSLWGAILATCLLLYLSRVLGQVWGLNDYFAAEVAGEVLYSAFRKTELLVAFGVVTAVAIAMRLPGRSALYVRVVPAAGADPEPFHSLDFSSSAVTNLHLRLDRETAANVAVLARRKGETAYTMFDHREWLPVATHEFVILDLSRVQKRLGERHDVQDPGKLVSVSLSYKGFPCSFDLLPPARRNVPIPAGAVELLTDSVLRNANLVSLFDDLLKENLRTLLGEGPRTAREYRDRIAQIGIDGSAVALEKLSGLLAQGSTYGEGDVVQHLLGVSVAPVLEDLTQRRKSLALWRADWKRLHDLIPEIPHTLPDTLQASLCEWLLKGRSQDEDTKQAVATLLGCVGIQCVVHDACTCTGPAAECEQALERMEQKYEERAESLLGNSATHVVEIGKLGIAQDHALKVEWLKQLVNLLLACGPNRSPAADQLMAACLRMLGQPSQGPAPVVDALNHTHTPEVPHMTSPPDETPLPGDEGEWWQN